MGVQSWSQVSTLGAGSPLSICSPVSKGNRMFPNDCISQDSKAWSPYIYIPDPNQVVLHQTFCKRRTVKIEQHTLKRASKRERERERKKERRRTTYLLDGLLTSSRIRPLWPPPPLLPLVATFGLLLSSWPCFFLWISKISAGWICDTTAAFSSVYYCALFHKEDWVGSVITRK